MAILYVTNPKEIKNIDISQFSLMFLIDKNDKLSKKLSKKIDITTFDKDGNLIYSNIIQNPYNPQNIEILNYFIFKKNMIAIKFEKEKAYIEQSYQSRKKTDKLFRPIYEVIYNFVTTNQDKELSIKILNEIDEKIEKSVFEYIEYLQPNFNNYQKKYFKKAFKIYQCMFYGLLSHINKKSKYAHPDIFSLLESHILFVLSEIFIHYKLEREDIKYREFSRDFLKIIFRLFNEQINHSKLKNILFYFKTISDEIESLEKGENLKGLLWY